MKTLKLTLLALATVMVVSCEKKTETAAVVEGTETAEVTTNETTSMETNSPALADASVTQTATTGAAPVFTMSNTTYDFGDVQANSTTERVVEFTNTGDAPLVITAAKASCGCTVPEYDKEPIAPGATGSLKVSYKAPGTNGKQTKTVTLTTNTAAGTERFKIAANVVGGAERQAPKPPVQQPARELPAPKLGQ